MSLERPMQCPKDLPSPRLHPEMCGASRDGCNIGALMSREILL